MSNESNTAINTHLGKSSEYISQYAPSLLVREPRQTNRTYLGIKDDELPFHGFDIWNAYEISTLLRNGIPVVGYAKIVYPADSKYIVESKSLKLYLNSFNMTEVADTPTNALEKLKVTIEDDLSKLLECSVNVNVFDASAKDTFIPTRPTMEYVTLEKILDVSAMQSAKRYTEDPSLLKGLRIATPVEQHYHSALLKSNCRVTKQPDWGDVYIDYVGDYMINPALLLHYIVSFRDECHFHEEIGECIFKRLSDAFEPKHLRVSCFYVRRGGIDINVLRASKGIDFPTRLIQSTAPFVKSLRQ